MWPHPTKSDFLYHGLVEVELRDALDCSICREPLATGATAWATSSLHLPDVNTNLPASQDTNVDSADVAAETPVNINPIFEHTFDAQGDDDEIIPEPAVRIRHCAHIFGSTCLSTWFATDTSNRCPECNQSLFPQRSFHLVLDYPTRETRIEFAHFIEDEFGDADTANQIRSQLMSEWTKMLMRNLAVEVHRASGYDDVTWEYRDPQEDEDEGYDDEEEAIDHHEEFGIYEGGIDEEVVMIEYEETEDEHEEDI
jgi:hypothetical protein